MSLTVIPDSGGDPAPMDKVVYTIHDRVTDKQQVAYSRAYHDDYEWNHPDYARNSMCDGYYEDRERFVVKKWLVTYTLVNGDVE